MPWATGRSIRSHLPIRMPCTSKCGNRTAILWTCTGLSASAEQLGGGKPVIIAAYIHPERADNVRLANAVIFASGGYHLELGEPDAMLADPYFPRFGLMDETYAIDHAELL